MICPYCGENMLLELEWCGEPGEEPDSIIPGHDWFPIYCCEALQEECSAGDQFELFKALTGGIYEDVRGVTSGMIDFKLTGRILQGGPDLVMAKAVVALHHRHRKKPPVSWRFGVGVWNGPTLVGVAVVGRAVARGYDKSTVVEVNRNCTIDYEGLERHAASKLYAMATQEAKRRGFKKIITYTHVDESGASIKAAWGKESLECRIKGRSWNTPSRPREDTGPIVDKNRWGKQLK